MAKKIEELPPAPPLPGAPHTIHTDELVKALGADPVKGFTDVQAQELQRCDPVPSTTPTVCSADALWLDAPSSALLQQIWAQPAEAAGEAFGQSSRLEPVPRSRASELPA
jgi:hypothetical protein